MTSSFAASVCSRSALRFVRLYESLRIADSPWNIGRFRDAPTEKEFVFYGNLTHPSDAVKHMGDNLTGSGEGDDEQIIVDLARIPAQYDRIVLVVNIYQAMQRKQHFGLIENAFIRLVDGKTNKEMCKYNLTESYPGMTAMIFGEVYRHNGEWKFSAIGQGTNDPGLGELVNRYIAR